MEPRLHPATDIEQSQPGRTILIVDDEEMIRDLCAKVLSNYHTLQAADGREALDLLSSREIDLVLTDVMMPGMNGLELLREIKQKNPNRAVVMMTGYGDKDVILHALKLHADDFISKPINLLQLRTLIAKALENMSLREELVELKKMDRLKSEFLGLVSHKLKTPVTVISLLIQNLAREDNDAINAEVRTNLTLIQEKTNDLSSLIQDLLLYSGKILQIKPAQHETTDLVGLAAAVLVELQDKASARELTLINNLPAELPLINIDREQIGFCVRALLDNAIKFSPGGGRITLTAQTLEQSLEISVSDEGPGISAEQQAKIFEKFFQIDPENTGQIRGFGLGLYYAREFLKEHNGQLSLQSRPGHGSVFTLSLPAGPRSDASHPT